MYKNIFLTGFMGSGKTTTGRLLSGLLKMDFYDLDELITREQGMKVAEIFRTKGEKYFRTRETEFLKRIILHAPEGFILATGGGVVLREENIIVMERNGIIVFLVVSASEAFRRLKNSSDRPLLLAENLQERIEELIQARMKFYQRAHICINTDSKNPQQVAEEIKNLILNMH